jgi:hypothetical protein
MKSRGSKNSRGTAGSPTTANTGYFSRLLGAAPPGVSPLRPPRQVAFSAPPVVAPATLVASEPEIDAVPARRSPQRRRPLPEAHESDSELTLGRAANVPPRSPARKKSQSLTMPRQAHDPAPRSASARTIEEQPQVQAQQPAAQELAVPRNLVSPETPSASEPPAKRLVDPPSRTPAPAVLDGVFSRAADRYRQEPRATEVPMQPQPLSLKAPAHPAPTPMPAEPAIEIGQIEIRLQPPAPPMRTPTPRTATNPGPLTRSRYLHGFRQS